MRGTCVRTRNSAFKLSRPWLSAICFETARSIVLSYLSMQLRCWGCIDTCMHAPLNMCKTYKNKINLTHFIPVINALQEATCRF